MALSEAARALQCVAVEFAGTNAGWRYRHFATLIESLSRLATWKDAVRSAEVDADRHVRAAKMLAREVAEEIGAELGVERLNDAVSRVLGVADFDDISAVARAVLAIALPLPLFSHEKGPAFPVASPPAADDVSVSVAFASFELDGALSS